MSMLRRHLEHVRGAGIAELRGFATYNVTRWASIRTQIWEPVFFEGVEAFDDTTAEHGIWTLHAIATIENGTRVIHREWGGNGRGLRNRRIFLEKPNGTRDGIAVGGGKIVELLIENTGSDVPRDFVGTLLGTSLAGMNLAGRPLNWAHPIGSIVPIGRAPTNAGRRTLIDLGGTVWRFCADERGLFTHCEETTMPDVEAQLVYPDHVHNFVTHYAHHPDAPVRFVSLHVWAGPPNGASVLYGIDETSDLLVMEIGSTDLTQGTVLPAKFEARLNLNGIKQPWWWDYARLQREAKFARQSDGG